MPPFVGEDGEVKQEQRAITEPFGGPDALAQVQGHGDLLAGRAIEGHRMLHPLDPAAVGGVSGKEQLWLDLGAPVAMQEIVGRVEIGLALAGSAQAIQGLGFFCTGGFQHRWWLHSRCPGLCRGGQADPAQQGGEAERLEPGALAFGSRHGRDRETAAAASRPPAKPLAWPIQLTPAGVKTGSKLGRTPP